MNKRYRLKKDLPGYKAGDVIEAPVSILLKDVNPENLPDWFEPLEVTPKWEVKLVYAGSRIGQDTTNYEIQTKLDSSPATAEKIRDKVETLMAFIYGEGKDNGQWPAIVSEARQAITEEQQ